MEGGGATAPDRAAASGLAARAAAVLAERTGVRRHDAVVVLGSGWAAAADELGEPVAELPVADLPGFAVPVAPGHPGTVRSYRLGRLALLCLIGRSHLYEGHGLGPVTLPVRTAAAAGCRIAVLTNANGSLVTEWAPGTGVLIRDHLYPAPSPLTGPRFVDLTDCWSRRLRGWARECDPALVQGVYAFLPGPHYQTPAEAAALRRIGADVVGMSTVPEAVVARAAGLELLGLSVVTSVELGPAAGDTDPAAVVAVAEGAAARLGTVIRTVLARAASAA